MVTKSGFKYKQQHTFFKEGYQIRKRKGTRKPNRRKIIYVTKRHFVTRVYTRAVVCNNLHDRNTNRMKGRFTSGMINSRKGSQIKCLSGFLSGGSNPLTPPLKNTPDDGGVKSGIYVKYIKPGG